MRSYTIQEPKKLATQEIEPPELREDEVLVKVSRIGICGSDVQLFQGTYKGPFSYPIAFGHEWSGTVERVGKKAKLFSPGDRVTGDCSRYCGSCDYCREDKNLCRDIEKFGITIDGASSEFIVRKGMYLYRAPDDIDLTNLCLSEPLAVGAHLIGKIERLIGPIGRKRVLVFGAGSIGLGIILLLLHHYGSAEVEVFDISDHRLRVAASLGAEILPADTLRQESKGSGYQALYGAKHDVIIESTGNAEVFARSLNLVKPLGVIGCLGMIPEAVIQQKLIVMKGLTIIGSIGGTGEFPLIIDFIHRNSERVRKLISHEYPIDEAEKALLMSRQTERAVKVILKLGR